MTSKSFNPRVDTHITNGEKIVKTLKLKTSSVKTTTLAMATAAVIGISTISGAMAADMDRATSNIGTSQTVAHDGVHIDPNDAPISSDRN